MVGRRPRQPRTSPIRVHIQHLTMVGQSVACLCEKDNVLETAPYEPPYKFPPADVSVVFVGFRARSGVQCSGMASTGASGCCGGFGSDWEVALRFIVHLRVLNTGGVLRSAAA